MHFTEKLSGVDFGPLTEVTQSVVVQKQKLGQFLQKVNELLDVKDQDRWSMACKLFASICKFILLQFTSAQQGQ